MKIVFINLKYYLKMKSVLILYLLVLALITNILDGESATVPKLKNKVVIVGAGISGLGAATHLLKNNFTDFLILEASNRFGGRVYSAPFADFIIEYGAQWIHGQENNLIYQLVEPYDIVDTTTSISLPTLVKNSKSNINITLANEITLEVFYFLSDHEKIISCNCSLLHYFEKRFEKFVKERNIDIHTAQAIKDSVLKYEASDSGTDDLSHVQTIPLSKRTGGNLDVEWKSGFSSFIDVLLGKYENNELPVLEKTKFNKVVQTIDWSGNEIQLTCEDGSQYYADHVITTVSLGVLKHSAKTMFTPSLPERKLSTIQALGFDVVGKIFLHFEKRWWPLKYDYTLIFLLSDEDKERFRNESKFGGWATEVGAFHYVPNQPRLLEGWVIGQTARTVEKLTDKEIIDALMEYFKWFLGDTYQIPEPINITRSSWHGNRFVRGTYSYHTVESVSKGYTNLDLAQPISHNDSKPVLMFAGEATHEYFWGYTHGALESGIREANRILSF